jgi:choice-of-anchor C domain-containing protein
MLRTAPRTLCILAITVSMISCNSKTPTQPTPQVTAHNLIVNGSFESGPRGPLTGTASIITYAGSTSIVGWTVTGSNIDYYVGEAPAADSLCCVDLNGYFAAGGIAQVIPTVTGAQYTVSFSLAGNFGGPPTVKQLRVSAAGQSGDFTFDTSGKSAANMGWTRNTWQFVANSSATMVAFETLTSASSAYGPMIDAVDVR